MLFWKRQYDALFGFVESNVNLSEAYVHVCLSTAFSDDAMIDHRYTW